MQIDSPRELRAEWASLIARLKTLHELEVEDFAEVCAVFAKMRRARMSVDEGAFALLGVLARQAFPFDDTDTDADGAPEWRGYGAGTIGGRAAA